MKLRECECILSYSPERVSTDTEEKKLLMREEIVDEVIVEVFS